MFGSFMAEICVKIPDELKKQMEESKIDVSNIEDFE